MPFYPQFDRRPLEVVRAAREAGAQTDEQVVDWTVEQLKEKKLSFAVNDPDAPENFPRVWLIWRANAMFASGKGHEYMLRHYLGTTDAKRRGGDRCRQREDGERSGSLRLGERWTSWWT